MPTLSPREREVVELTAWNPAQDQILREALTDGKTFAEASAMLGRTKNACVGRANRLGIKSAKRPNFWRPEETHALDDMISEEKSFGEIAAALGKSKGAVLSRWRKIVREMGGQAV